MMPSAALAHSWKALDLSFVSNGRPSSFKEDCPAILSGILPYYPGQHAQSSGIVKAL
jgi:hypothetical protein